MAVTARFEQLEEFNVGLLNISNARVHMVESVDMPVPPVPQPHIPNQWQNEGNVLPPPPAPPGTEHAQKIGQMNLQKDQPLFFIFQWNQDGLFTLMPPHIGPHLFEYRLKVMFEKIGPGEVPVIPGTEKSVDLAHPAPGNFYSEFIQIGGFGQVNPLPEGVYRVYAKFSWGIKGLPHTPISGIAEVAILNVYTF